MIISDFHTHTVFSPDSEQNIEELILYAGKTGIKYLAITDHFDNGSVYVPQNKQLDIKKYFDTVSSYKRFAQKNNVDLAVGIEMGFTPQNNIQNADIINTYDFDYVINSVHEVKGLDCYFKEYHEGKDRYTSYYEYFKTVSESIDAPYYYSTIGHLGYVIRKSPYTLKEYKYSEFNDILDEILIKIIKKEKILEVNTSTHGLEDKVIPSYEVIKRYYELGGRLITFGSDAHSILRLGEKSSYVSDMLKEIGFKNLTLVKNRRHYEVEI